MPSVEYARLKALDAPPETSRVGDIWSCQRLGMVILAIGHQKNTGRKRGLHWASLYHWRQPSLRYHPATWRDDDPDVGSVIDDLRRGGRSPEKWTYVGNIFQMLPLSEVLK